MEADEYCRFQKLLDKYPLERCCKIATLVLDSSDVPVDDRICAAGILNALEAAEHVQDLTYIGVSRGQLHAAARADAARLWSVYGEEENQTEPGK